MDEAAIDLRGFLDGVRAIVERHRLPGVGLYARGLPDGATSAEANPYGSADAANLLYTLDEFPAASQHADWIIALQSFQEVESGLFREATHHPLHTTAHVAGALQLFSARPLHRLAALDPWRDGDALERFLDELDWSWNPWGESHKGAGLYAAMVLAGEAELPWQTRYFDWLAREVDPHSGFWRCGHVAVGGNPLLFHHLAGSFHYLFNHEHAGRALPYRKAMLDSCLRIRRDNLFPLACSVGFAELDWVYCVHRCARQLPALLAEARQALSELAHIYTTYLFSLDVSVDAGLNDLHQLLGAVSALAELQQAVPGLVHTTRPLRLVLDRRPFI